MNNAWLQYAREGPLQTDHAAYSPHAPATTRGDCRALSLWRAIRGAQPPAAPADEQTPWLPPYFERRRTLQPLPRVGIPASRSLGRPLLLLSRGSEVSARDFFFCLSPGP